MVSLAHGLPQLSTHTVAVLAAVLLFGVFVLINFSRSVPKLPLPPGPQPDPIIGNVRQFPRHHYVKTFTEWKHQFGDVVYTNVMGQSIIILNSRRAIEDLMVKRALQYQHRPIMFMLMKLAGWGWFASNKQPGHEHSEERRIMISSFSPSTVKAWYPLIERVTGNFIRQLADRRVIDVMPTMKQYLAEAMLRIAYGDGVYDANKAELLETNMNAINLTNEIISELWPVDAFTFLQYLPRWFPGTSFWKVAEKNQYVSKKVKEWPFELVTNECIKGVAHQSFTRQALENGCNPERVKEAVGVFYIGALDTSSIILSTFILAMQYYPQVQLKVQAEIDEFVATEGRLPGFHDREKLRYLEVVIKEVMRWNPPAPSVLPHVNAEEDEYMGMRIPKNSTIFANVWDVLHDTLIWRDPDNFRPERFLEDINKTLPDPGNFIFGFGRRVCPGKHLAERVIYYMTVQIVGLFTVTISPGQNPPPVAEFDTNFFSHPIVPKAELVVRNTALMPMH